MKLVYFRFMMRIKNYLFVLFVCCSVIGYSQELNVYSLQLFERNEQNKIAFTSLSDTYEKADSLAIPRITGKENSEVGYLELEGEYRERFFSGTHVLESDNLFIYDFITNKLLSFPVKDLKVVACIHPYADKDDFPFSVSDYQIGFEIDRSKLTGFSDNYYSSALICIGAKNPFEKGKMKPLKWETFDAEKLDKTMRYSLSDVLITEGYKNFEPGNVYSAKADGFRFLLQEIVVKEEDLHFEHLMVVDQKTNEIVCNLLFANGGRESLAPLNGMNPEFTDSFQWAGKLFKEKPPVVFGFSYFSSGCPAISFLEKGMEDVYIRCDNRY